MNILSIFISIALFVFAIESFNAQEPIINSLEIFPSNPSNEDTVLIISHTITSSLGFQFNEDFNHDGQEFTLQRCFFLGVNTGGGHYVDTVFIYPNELSVGSYTVYYNAYATYNESECAPVNTAKDSVTFSVGFLNIQEENLSDTEVVVFPNPSNTTHTLQFTVPANTKLTVHLYDMQGRKLKNIFNGQVSDGNFQQAIDVSKLDNGVYFYGIAYEGKRQMVRFVK